MVRAFLALFLGALGGGRGSMNQLIILRGGPHSTLQPRGGEGVMDLQLLQRGGRGGVKGFATLHI